MKKLEFEIPLTCPGKSSCDLFAQESEETISPDSEAVEGIKIKWKGDSIGPFYTFQGFLVLHKMSLSWKSMAPGPVIKDC